MAAASGCVVTFLCARRERRWMRDKLHKSAWIQLIKTKSVSNQIHHRIIKEKSPTIKPDVVYSSHVQTWNVPAITPQTRVKRAQQDSSGDFKLAEFDAMPSARN